MAKLIMLKGLQASGKSTWAKEQVAKSNGMTKRISKDCLRDMLDAGVWSSGNEKIVLLVRDQLINLFLGMGKDVIVDDTNFKPSHKTRLQDLANKAGAVFEEKFFYVDLEEAIRRDLKRPNPVGERVIRDTYTKYLRSPVLPKLPYNSNLPDCIICDLDGTLAINDHGRDFYRASECYKDAVNSNVQQFIDLYTSANECDLIFVSGRYDTYKTQTEQWLKDKVGITYEYLYMRKEGDMRSDTVVKEEIYNNHIKDKYNVLLVLDDRTKVVNLWRSLGLETWQVQEGNY